MEEKENIYYNNNDGRQYQVLRRIGSFELDHICYSFYIEKIKDKTYCFTMGGRTIRTTVLISRINKQRKKQN